MTENRQNSLFTPIKTEMVSGKNLPVGKTKLIIKDIVKTEQKEFTADDGRTNYKVFVTMKNDDVWKIPPTVNNDIHSYLIKYGERLLGVEIERVGTGKNDTRYKVLPEV